MTFRATSCGPASVNMSGPKSLWQAASQEQQGRRINWNGSPVIWYAIGEMILPPLRQSQARLGHSDRVEWEAKQQISNLKL